MVGHVGVRQQSAVTVTESAIGGGLPFFPLMGTPSLFSFGRVYWCKLTVIHRYIVDLRAAFRLVFLRQVAAVNLFACKYTPCADGRLCTGCEGVQCEFLFWAKGELSIV